MATRPAEAACRLEEDGDNGFNTKKRRRTKTHGGRPDLGDQKAGRVAGRTAGESCREDREIQGTIPPPRVPWISRFSRHAPRQARRDRSSVRLRSSPCLRVEPVTSRSLPAASPVGTHSS
jgi:hypothetical protein